MAGQSDFTYYHYTPSLAAAIVFAALFLVTTILHCYQLIRTRTWYLLPLLIGGFCETIGYLGRAKSADEDPNYTLGPYIIQSILLLIAPVLFSASIYMVLGYVILLTDGEQYSPIRKKFLTKFFVLGDFFAFMVQSTGASLTTKKDQDSKDTGNWIIIGGLVIQILSFGYFMIVSVIFHCRLLATPTPRIKLINIPWHKHLIVLYLTSTLIMVRSVFRTVEYIQGRNGYLLRNELWIYIFDAALMWFVVALFNAVHPSEVNGLLKGKKAMRWVVLTQKMKKVGEFDVESAAMAPYPINEQDLMPKAPGTAHHA